MLALLFLGCGSVFAETHSSAGIRIGGYAPVYGRVPPPPPEDYEQTPCPGDCYSWVDGYWSPSGGGFATSPRRTSHDQRRSHRDYADYAEHCCSVLRGCDLWSNESVQNIRLLSGNAPEAFAELLTYDCRLMNMAASKHQELVLRDWLTESDEWLSPQAAVLSLSATIRIAAAITSATTPYRRTIDAGLAAVHVLRDGLASGRLKLSAKESQWLNRIETELTDAPTDEGQLLAAMIEQHEGHFDAATYGL